jgi:hypothetical protein
MTYLFLPISTAHVIGILHNRYLCIKGIMKMFMFEGDQFKSSRAARPESF